MRKHIVLGLVATTVLASPAFSGGFVAPVTDTQVGPFSEVSPRAFTWTGPYAGLYLGRNSFDLKATSQIDHEALTREHAAITKDIPAEVIEHPAVTEERVVGVIEHPEITETRVVGEIDHPAEVEVIPAEIKNHPEEKGLVQIGTKEVQIGTEKIFIREDVYRDENGGKQRDENHPTGWRHVPVYDDRPVFELQPVLEERVIKEAWVEVVTPEREIVTRAAWTETVTETVLVQEARVEEITQTVVVEQARLEIVRPAETVVLREAWTEVVRDAWSEQLTEEFSENGNAYGIFAGYRHQWQNNVVAGIEAHYGRNGANDFRVGGDSASFGRDHYGVEVQAGVAIRRALPYLAVGYSQVLDNDAVTLSLGLDYALTDRLVVGAKYSRHDLGEIGEAGSMRRLEADGDTVSLRAAIRF